MLKYTIYVNGYQMVYQGMIEGLTKVAQTIINTLTTKEFYNYFGERLKEQLEMIAVEELNLINEENLPAYDKINYLSSMGMEVRDNSIYLFNNAVIDDIPSRIKNDDLLDTYPLKLSLAKIIEYGIGYQGATNPVEYRKDWQYDINEHGSGGWNYIDLNGQGHHTNGLEGRLVFLKICQWLEDNAGTIVKDYLRDNLKDWGKYGNRRKLIKNVLQFY